MPDSNSFDDNSSRRIGNVVRTVESTPTNGRGRDKVNAPVNLVEITGEINTDTGLYPGKVVTYTHDGDTWNDLGEVRVKPVNGDAVEVGSIVLCRFSGRDDTGGFGVYVAGPSGGEQLGRWIRIEESSASGTGGTWKGIVYNKDGSGGYEDGAAIRATFTPNGGETFIISRDYWATLNGTIEDWGTPRVVTDGVLSSSTTVTSATASFTGADVGAKIEGAGIPAATTITAVGSATSVTISAAALATSGGVTVTITPLEDFPLYHSLGSDKVIVPVCRGGNEECDLWVLPAPVSITENVDCETGEPL